MKVSHYYGNSVSSQANTTLVESNGIEIYYSYETIVAIRVNGHLTIAKNIWGTTTGKHLNAIDRDKKIRVDYDELQKLINELKVTI